jgi:hypothetical protein
MANNNKILEKGNNVFIRTVTHYHTGEIVDKDNLGITLGTAAWIPDTGRFSTALKGGVLNEVEPFPGPVFIPYASIIDATLWKHPLPTEQK